MIDDLGVVGNGMGITSRGGDGWGGGCLQKLRYVKTMSSFAKLLSST